MSEPIPETEVAKALREQLAREVARADFTGFSDRVLARVAADRPAPVVERVRVWLREALTFHPVRMALVTVAAVAIFVGTPAMLIRGGEDNTSIVRALEFGGGGGTVYQANDGTTIIWIGEGT